jgi:S1-C subfamily serine protease
LSPQLILTNAHVVKSAVDIRVRKHGSTRRFPARCRE